MGALTEISKVKEIEKGSILTPRGFSAGGIHAGLRYTKKDIGMIVSEVPATSAAVYTINHFQAAPLKVTQDSLKESSMLQAVVVNSANANACTGERGLRDAFEMRRLTGKKLGIKEHLVAVASTGVIGEYLPMDKIKKELKNWISVQRKNMPKHFKRRF